MPTYSYRCAACGHAFDQYQAFADDTLTECPACHEPRLRKQFNSIGVTFNGSGFYRNDSRGGGADAAGSAPSGSDSSGSAASDSGSKPSESKPKAAPAAASASSPAASKE